MAKNKKDKVLKPFKIIVHCTLFVADKKMNAMMEGFDMRPSHKVFIRPIDTSMSVDLSIAGSVDEVFFNKIIQKSKSHNDYWIPVILYNGLYYKDPEIKVISDGVHEMFIRAADDVSHD
jgi:hypothetical protein